MGNIENKEELLEEGTESTVDTEGTENKEEKEEKQKSERTFTQEEVNRMMAREKKQGRAALLKELGYKDEKSAMSASKTYNAWLEAQKSEEQKSNEKENEKQRELLEAQAKADAAEAKVEAMMLGCKPENVDDVIALAMAKKTDDGDFKSVIGELKKKYPSMFEKTSEDEDGKEKEEETKKTKGQRGTGGSVAPKEKEKKKDEQKSLGSRLAANRRNNRSEKKSSFWG